MAESQEDKADVNQEERFAKWERAFQILKDAVQENRLRDFSEYRDDEPLEGRWEIYKRDYAGDVGLVIVITGLFGKLYWEFLLIRGVVHIVEELEKLLRMPNADKLFALSDEDDIKEIVNFHARPLISNYINHLPVAMYQALNQALTTLSAATSRTFLNPTSRSIGNLLEYQTTSLYCLTASYKSTTSRLKTCARFTSAKRDLNSRLNT